MYFHSPTCRQYMCTCHVVCMYVAGTSYLCTRRHPSLKQLLPVQRVTRYICEPSCLLLHPPPASTPQQNQYDDNAKRVRPDKQIHGTQIIPTHVVQHPCDERKDHHGTVTRRRGDAHSCPYKSWWDRRGQHGPECGLYNTCTIPCCNTRKTTKNPFMSAHEKNQQQ